MTRMLDEETPESIYEALTAADGHEVFWDLPDQVGAYTLTEIRRWGGEGQGDYMGVVFSLTGPDVRYYSRYFEMTGFHSSWDASEWDGDLTEVVPVTQTVTFYARKDGY